MVERAGSNQPTRYTLHAVFNIQSCNLLNISRGQSEIEGAQMDSNISDVDFPVRDLPDAIVIQLSATAATLFPDAWLASLTADAVISAAELLRELRASGHRLDYFQVIHCLRIALPFAGE